MLKSRIAAIGLFLAAFGLGAGHASGDTIRLAIQKTGTVAWELDVIRAHALDKQADITVQSLELANPEAGKIALRGGSVDIVVGDWFWVSRERELGAKLVFYPYSSALGAVMVPGNSAIRTLSDLRGHTVAVAGGSIDKSWLLLQAAAKQRGVDLSAQSKVAYGSPALLAVKMLNGDYDATLTYWNFAAQLEARGFRRLVGVDELLPDFGIAGPLSMIGYVFDETWAASHRRAVDGFLEATRKAKEILRTSDAEWERIAPLVGARDPAALKVYRDRYRQGIPLRSIDDEENDARALYGVLGKLGGPALVGQGEELAPGTFYRPAAD